ncbi:MAG: uracil-DNA glycosylase [Bacteroidales bacterium]|nr:uracil-DNA glycosylase [Bacteroidales bacterium]MBQ3677311.1 uracil-DNA glycosylase [Bacteroidales bacterium]
MDPKIEPSWKNVLIDEFNKPYFVALKEFLVEEKKKYVVYPAGANIFNAFACTPFNKVKVVIIGQDPYHGPGQAHGLSFSVPEGIQKPPSLVNIFKELQSDIGKPIPESGNLESWARQGVLLLNATLTVRANQAGSHQKHGWEQFTDSVIRTLSDQKSGLVFLLWGRFAQDKAALIDASKHHILKAAHPSPLSAYNGFFGCKHFSKTNEILLSQGETAIEW